MGYIRWWNRWIFGS